MYPEYIAQVGQSWNENRGREVARGEQYRAETEGGEEEVQESEEEEGACGKECRCLVSRMEDGLNTWCFRNLAHELDHPEEDDRCPYPMEIDVYGYCR